MVGIISFRYTQGMRRVFLIFLCLLMALSLFAARNYQTLDALRYSNLTNTSYFGDVYHVYDNPAALSFITSGDKYQFVAGLSESYNPAAFGREAVPYIQNLDQEFLATVTSGHLALSAKGSNRFDDRAIRSGETIPDFDIYSNIDLEIDVAFSYKEYFSAGLFLSGGNSLVRLNQPVSNVIIAVENAWFSPYETLNDSGRYQMGFGLQGRIYEFSLGYCTRELKLTDSSFTEFLQSTLSGDLGLSYRANKYSSYGDLKLFVPRVSLSMKGFFTNSTERNLSVKTDLLLQFMKNFTVDAGLGYTYEVVEAGEPRGIFGISFLSNYFDYSLGVEVAIDTLNNNCVMPSIYFSVRK